MSHKIGDGYSVHMFIEKWSRMCCNLAVEKPLLDRSALSPNSSQLVDEHPEYSVVEPSSAPPHGKKVGIERKWY